LAAARSDTFLVDGKPALVSDLSDSIRFMTRITATEAARSFSELLNRVAAGEEIEVTRSGADVAVISPPKSRLISADRFRELIATAPLPDERMLEDMRALRESVEPPADAWPS
jgi:prevent-host-death family protein